MAKPMTVSAAAITRTGNVCGLRVATDSSGGRSTLTRSASCRPMPTPAMIAPVNSRVSKKCAPAVTGAPVMASWIDWTSVRPASRTMIPEATIWLGLISAAWFSTSAQTTAAGMVAMTPPATHWKK